MLIVLIIVGQDSDAQKVHGHDFDVVGDERLDAKERLQMLGDEDGPLVPLDALNDDLGAVLRIGEGKEEGETGDGPLGEPRVDGERVDGGDLEVQPLVHRLLHVERLHKTVDGVFG